MAAGRYDLAANFFRSALQSNPWLAEAYAGLAQCTAALGDCEGAVAGLVDTAATFKSHGLFDQASLLLGSAVQLAPHRLELHVEVAELELAAGKTIVARQRLESLTRAYAHRGEHEAAAAVQEVIAQWSLNPFSEVIKTEVAPVLEPPRQVPVETAPAPEPKMATPAKPRARRKSRTSAVLEIRPKAPPLAKPKEPLQIIGTPHPDAVRPAMKTPASAARSQLDPSTLPAPGTGRAISGASVDAKLRFETLRKRASGGFRSLPVPGLRRGQLPPRGKGGLVDRLRVRAGVSPSAPPPSEVPFDEDKTQLWIAS
jgi:hypothetical protein